MINQVKQLAHGLLTASLLGCGVASEVATHQPSSAPLSVSLAEPASEHPAQAPGRPGIAHSASVASAPKTPVQLAAVATRRPTPPTPSVPLSREATSAGALPVGTANRRIQAGRIIDEAGQPLVGATVLLKGTTRGTSTDANGDYSLPVPLGTNTFVFAYSGYQEEVAQSRDGQPLTVTLLPIPGQVIAAPEPNSKQHHPKAHPRKGTR